MELQLPERKKPARTSFNTNPDAIKAWVDDLPLLNTEQTRQMLNDALDEINTLDIPTENRHMALELLSTSVMCVTDALKKNFLGKPLPLQESDRMSATQALDTCNRMATGYRILADDLGRNVNQESQLAIAIHRSLRYLSELLLIHYQIYIQYPDGLWKSIHALYALAEECSINTLPVTDPTSPASEASTIATIYKQILLLSLACPYRMPQKEIHYIYNALLDWARFCRLVPASNTRANGLFTLNLQSDKPPGYRVLADDRTSDKYTRILDTTAATEQLRDVLSADNVPAVYHTGIGDTETLQQLMLAWGAMPKRKYPRHHRHAAIKLVTGINAIHSLIAGPAGNIEEDDGSISDHHYLPDPTFDSTTSFTTRAEMTDHMLRGAFSAQLERDSHIEFWRIADTSAGGYCLLRDNAIASSARVGELVAIVHQEDDSENNWQLGVIRWMKFTGEHGLELGIQLLAPAGVAIWAFACSDDFQLDPRIGKRMQGILLPEIKVLGQQASLLLPSLPFRAGCTSILEQDGRRENIFLTRQLENTGCFAQFHFSLACS
jgi:cyclic-di-GMP-binding protein